ncbi:hypothetical protein LWI28_020408 [Acer negundo]|uniref:Late embryogenesis abundant protein LEA-2 subgroup domain-containing protein n=1 Tax=Acer negundo TaxID=4023 RepID=A0AAD5I7P5_ACENE|nr:hypothetical protein LWI28_020408 [Acer negundo]
MSAKSDCGNHGHRRRRLFQRIIAGILIFLLIALITILLVWAILRPTKPRFIIQDATVYAFNVSSPNLLTSNFQVTISSRNPNDKVGIYYDRLDIYAIYRNQQITYRTAIPSTYQGHKEINVWSPYVYGTAVPVAPYNAVSLAEDQNNGVIPLIFKIDGRVRWKVGTLITAKYHLYVKCDAMINFGNKQSQSGIVVGTLSEAHQRALQVEKTITRRGGGGLLSGNDSGTATRTCTSSGITTSRAAAFSSDVVPRPVAHPKQQPRSPSGLRCFSYGEVKHIQSECKKVVFVELEDSQEELVENIGVEPIFDEEEEVQEEDVGVGEEPQFDVVETMEEDLVDSDTGALEQRLCAEGQQFEEEDEAETRDELQFDGEEMVTEDWVEGDVGLLLMVRPAVITIIDDVKPEIDEEECYSAPKFDKEVVLGRDDTAEVQGTTMY